MLLQISSNYFVACVQLESFYVVHWAPILSYMRGWPLEKVIKYSVLKEWQIYEI